jgi:hypothetical protein
MSPAGGLPGKIFGRWLTALIAGRFGESSCFT